mmetsp:Transcript_56873/g.133640  ORF Transcript_56873/g.133640 Transcript_56873/m.133640 type:complete len:229 (+) Transcript_56873:541-1227(+)
MWSCHTAARSTSLQAMMATIASTTSGSTILSMRSGRLWMLQLANLQLRGTVTAEWSTTVQCMSLPATMATTEATSTASTSPRGSGQSCLSRAQFQRRGIAHLPSPTRIGCWWWEAMTVRSTSMTSISLTSIRWNGAWWRRWDRWLHHHHAILTQQSCAVIPCTCLVVVQEVRGMTSTPSASKPISGMRYDLLRWQARRLQYLVLDSATHVRCTTTPCTSSVAMMVSSD